MAAGGRLDCNGRRGHPGSSLGGAEFGIGGARYVEGLFRQRISESDQQRLPAVLHCREQPDQLTERCLNCVATRHAMGCDCIAEQQMLAGCRGHHGPLIGNTLSLEMTFLPADAEAKSILIYATGRIGASNNWELGGLITSEGSSSSQLNRRH